MSMMLPREINDAIEKHGYLYQKARGLNCPLIVIEERRIRIPITFGKFGTDIYHYHLIISPIEDSIAVRKGVTFVDPDRKEIPEWQPEYTPRRILWGSTFPALKERIIRECQRKHIGIQMPNERK